MISNCGVFLSANAEAKQTRSINRATVSPRALPSLLKVRDQEQAKMTIQTPYAMEKK